MARVKVMLPLTAEGVETTWLPVLGFYSSEEAGSFILPEIEDMVVVAFMDTNMTIGVVLGAVWHTKRMPPETEENTDADLNQDGENNLKFIKSRSGSQIILDDTDGEEKVQILSPEGTTRFEFLVGDETINVETDVDLIISAEGKIQTEAEEVESTAEKGLSIEAENLSVDINKDQEVTVSKNMCLDGKGINLN